MYLHIMEDIILKHDKYNEILGAFIERERIMISNNKVEIKIINKSDNPLPSYATPESAAVDIYANESVIIKSFGRASIKTGLYVEIPNGYYMDIRSRSGLAIKYGIKILPGVGTIDSDYRGELIVLLENTDKFAQEIKKGDRIAQAMVKGVTKIQWKVVESLETSVRGSRGFGSTGKNKHDSNKENEKPISSKDADNREFNRLMHDWSV